MMGALIDAAPGQLTVRVTRSGFFAIDGAGSCFLNWLQGVGGGPAGRQAGWGGGRQAFFQTVWSWHLIFAHTAAFGSTLGCGLPAGFTGALFGLLCSRLETRWEGWAALFMLQCIERTCVC